MIGVTKGLVSRWFSGNHNFTIETLFKIEKALKINILMLPAQFPEQNFEYVKPSDMTDEQCTSLPVFKGLDPEGMPIIISKWKLSKEDLEDINRTGEIWLQIAGNTMPPVSLYTENPFK